MTDSNETVLKIPEELSKELKIRAEDKGFKSLQDYVTYILRQVLSKIEMDEKQKKEPSTKEGEEEIKQKLRDLGYLE